MRFRLIAAMAAVIAPAVVSGQGGMGGMGGMGRGGRGGRGDFPSPRAQKIAAAKEIEALNPAKLLLDKRKKLALSDSQAVLLQQAQQRIFERNAPQLAVYDSIRKEIKLPSMPSGGMGGPPGGFGGGMGGPPGGEMGAAPQSDEAMAKLQVQMQALQTVVKDLRARREADVSEALALIPPDQLKKATEMLGDQNEAFDKLLPRTRDTAPRQRQERELERR